MLYPAHIEQKLGFDKIRERVKSFCLSSLGTLQVDAMLFATDFDFLHTTLHQTAEFKNICLYENNFPTSYYIDVRPYLNKIRLEGMFLEVSELFDLRRSLEAIKEILNFFNTRREPNIYPYLQQLTNNIRTYPFVTSRIDTIINKHGHIRDNASPDLARIRADIAQLEARASKICHSLLRQAQADGIADEDASLAVRDGKMLIPVQAVNKRRIKGIVHDESATGRTAYIEPYEIIEINNDIREQTFAERREVIRILIDFANQVRPYIDDLLLGYDFLAQIDFIRAKAQFAIDIEASLPQFVREPIVQLRQARHPLLFLSFRQNDRKVVPLDIELIQSNRIVVISGPNAGGKSVCLKTVGLLQYMLQCGLLVSAADYSVVGIFQHIFIDIGDEQSLENDLSTYSSHLLNMRNFVQNADNQSLILIDEFGTGTEPMLGGAIAESILEQLNHVQAKGVITTHYTNLKHYASQTDGIINGAMLYDTEHLRPLYRFEAGHPGSSFAFEIAAKIGLPDDVLQRAAQKVGTQHIDYDKTLREIEIERRQIADERQQIADIQQRLDSAASRYEQELEKTLRERKTIMAQAREQANDVVNRANKQIENTIAEIRRNQADKEKTKQARQQLEEFKKQENAIQQTEEERINAKMEQIKRRQERKKEQQNQPTKPVAVVAQKPEDKVIRTGDIVRLIKQKAIGEVLEIKGKETLVAIGNMQTSTPLDNLEKISRNEAKRYERKPASQNHHYSNIAADISKKKLDFSYGIDVRGLRADEAVQRVASYIDEAIVVQASEVKILHGTGNGILRQVIRQYLGTVDVVHSVTDERVESGGSGISVVKLDF